MKIKNQKGDAVLEFILILPFLCLFLVSLHWLYQLEIQKQKSFIFSEEKIKETLKKQQFHLPVLDRPCVVSSAICRERRE